MPAAAEAGLGPWTGAGAGAGMPLLADSVLELPVSQGGTRCRVQVYAAAGAPVVVLTGLDDNPGLPVPAVIARLAEVVRATVLPWVAGEPVWVEAWWGRALASLVNRARPPATTYMRVDLTVCPPSREPIRRAALEAVIGSRLAEPD